jgi:hypothetical protein
MGRMCAVVMKVAILQLMGLVLQGCVSPNGTLNFINPSGQNNGIAANAISWNGFTQIQTNQCSMYTISVPSSSAPQVISFSPAGAGSFYSNGSCSTSVSSVIVPANSNIQTVYYSSPVLGSFVFQANSPSLASGFYYVTVSQGALAPSINGVAPQVYPNNPLPVGVAMTTASFVNLNSGNNNGMTYTCYFAQGNSTSYSTSCSSLPGVTFNAAAATFDFTPQISSEWGSYTFQVTGTNSAGQSSTTFQIDISPAYSTTNLLIDYSGDYASLTSPNINSPMATTWRNIASSGSSYDGLLSGFPTTGATSNGWSGSGTTSSPYGLTFAGSEYIEVATELSTTPTMFTTWVSPNNIASVASGGVIFSTNNNGASAGMTLRQSARVAGTYELETVGGYSYYTDLTTQDTGTIYGYWRLGDSGANMVDSSGQNDGGNYYLSSTSHAPTSFASGAIVGDTTAKSVSVPYSSSGPTFGNASTSFPMTGNPQVYTEEIWFKTTAGYNQGGYLMGFGSSANGASSQSDRKIWMTNTGLISTGIYNGSPQVVTSPLSYNDGFWHQAAATYTGNGTTGTFMLYVDGTLVGSLTGSTVSAAENISSGFWRIGYDTMTGFTPTPSSNEFLGQLAEASVHTSVLPASTIQRHYVLGNRSCQSSVISTNGNWTMLGATYDGTTATLYVNGTATCQTDFISAGNFPNSPVPLFIGGSTGGAPWTGSMADFKAYSTESGSVITSIYNATIHRF